VLIAGAEVTREDSSPVRRTFTGVPTTPLLTPDPNDAFSGTGTVSSRVKSRVATIAGYVTDTLKFGRFWDLIAGFRWDSVHAGYEQTAGTAFTGRNHNDEIPSWRGGLVYRPADTTSLYFSYATSFNPSAEQLSLSAANANLDPEKNASYEIGGKWSAPDGDLMVSAAVFRTEKTNARVPDPNDSALNVLQGRQRADGVEIGASGRLSARWQIFGGYTYMDAKLRESTTASEIGARLANAPEHSGSLWASYSVSDRWQAGLGVTAISERAATTSPDAGTGRVRKAEGYSRVDAMAKYSFSKAASLQLNVANLTDAEYIDGLYPAHVIPGAGRSFLLTGTMEF
jgi:catecholate siderophore receptor